MIGTRRRRRDDLSAAAASYDRDGAVLYHFLVACGDEQDVAERMANSFATHFGGMDDGSCPSRTELLRTAQLVSSGVCDCRATEDQPSLVARVESLALVACLDVADIAYVLDLPRQEVHRLLDHTLRRLAATSADV
ncbi:MAG: hypothetical protein KDB40_09295 [Acidimicrobiales bacterium]|nr:hypothetical protein [Acidimicrobiales bacterium]MCB9395683.1 hypothetical protein [Acidimicrobiaceae bacterium]